MSSPAGYRGESSTTVELGGSHHHTEGENAITTQQYYVSATSDDGTREELVEAAYLPALATARCLVQEARTPGGSVDYDALAGRWLVLDAQGSPSASIAVSGPCPAQPTPGTP